jgi:hypothetical protein
MYAWSAFAFSFGIEIMRFLLIFNFVSRCSVYTFFEGS